MVVLCRSFFTPEVVRAIRSSGGFSCKLWEAYRNFHSSNLEKVSSKNAIYIMNEFRNTCETIQTFPTEIYVRQFLNIKYP